MTEAQPCESEAALSYYETMQRRRPMLLELGKISSDIFRQHSSLNKTYSYIANIVFRFPIDVYNFLLLDVVSYPHNGLIQSGDHSQKTNELMELGM
jgi:hypothetical protein